MNKSLSEAKTRVSTPEVSVLFSKDASVRLSGKTPNAALDVAENKHGAEALASMRVSRAASRRFSLMEENTNRGNTLASVVKAYSIRP